MERSIRRHVHPDEPTRATSVQTRARIRRLVLQVVMGVACGVVTVSPICAQSQTNAQGANLPQSRAELLLAVGKYRDALTEFERMRKTDTSSSVAWLGMGRAQEGLERWTDAIHSYEVYAQREPADAAGHELLGHALANMGKHSAALASYRKAQRLKSPSADIGAALSLHALGRSEEAMRSIRVVAKGRPEDSPTWGQLASVALELGHPAEAASYWEEALRRDPGYFDERAAERALWEGLAKERQAGSERPDIVVSADVPRAAPGDSGGVAGTRKDSTAPVVAAPYSPRISRASRSTAFFPGPSSTGTGFVISRDAGYVLTNKHVVRACGQVKVRAGGGKSRVATVKAIDSDDDLALLKVALPSGPTAVFRQDPAVRPGDDIVVVGFPLAGLLADQANVSTGSVNALAGLYNDLHLLQMSAPVQPGSSGGALFDASGNVVGVVVTKLNAKAVAEETGDIPQNVNFAVKADVARDFLREHGVPFRTAPSAKARSNADVGEMGRQVTILVECWP